jgi:hypothetical protein
MRVRIRFQQDKVNINEVFDGATAEEIVGKMKERVRKELPFALRLLVGGMSNLMFAQETVKRYNEAQKKSLPPPRSCEEFLKMAQAEGLATLEAG